MKPVFNHLSTNELSPPNPLWVQALQSGLVQIGLTVIAGMTCIWRKSRAGKISLHLGHIQLSWPPMLHPAIG